MFTYEVTRLCHSDNSDVQRKAELYNIDTHQTHYILFREHDADKSQLSAIFTDDDYNVIKSTAVLQAINGHEAYNLQVGDILEIIL